MKCGVSLEGQGSSIFAKPSQNVQEVGSITARYQTLRGILEGKEDQPSPSSNTQTITKENSQHKLPRYQTLPKILSTSIGTIYLAKDTETEQEVFLKRYHPPKELQYLVDLLLRKAVDIQSLNHLHIAKVYRIDHDDEGTYLTMEKLNAPSLHHFLKERKILPIQDALQITRSLASALAFSHKKGIYNGVINPHTILINTKNEKLEPKIADFFLCLEDQDPTLEFYLAPECKNKEMTVDHRADIYSLGSLLYYMLTAETPQNLNLQKISSELRKIIAQATEPQREKRFVSMEDFYDALNSLEKVNTQSATIDKTELCPMCGAYNPKGKNFCSSCGAGLLENCPKCGKENHISAKICINCGVNIEQQKNIQFNLLNARTSAKQGDLETALIKIDEILATDAQLPEAKELKEKWQTQKLELEQNLMMIEALLEEGIFQRSLAKLEAIYPNYPSSTRLGETLKKFVHSLEQANYPVSVHLLEDAIQKKNYSQVLLELKNILEKYSPQQTTSTSAFEAIQADTKRQTGVFLKDQTISDIHKTPLPKKQDKFAETGWYDLDEFSDLSKFGKTRRIKKLIEKAKRLLAKGEFADCIKVCKKILSEDRTNPTAKKLLRQSTKKGKALKKLAIKAKENEEFEEYKEALKLWKKALRLAPKKRSIREKINRLKAKIRDEDFDIDEFLEDDTLEEDWDDYDEEDWDDYDEDLEEDDLEIEERSERIKYLLYESQAALKRGEFGEAYKLAQMVLELEWNHPQAKQLAETAKEQGLHLKGLVEDAQLAEKVGNLEKAYKLWQEALSVAPNNEIVLQKYNTLQQQLGTISTRILPQEELEKAERCLAANQLPEAIKICENILQSSPDHEEAKALYLQAKNLMNKAQNYLSQGRELIAEGNFEPAIEILEKALKIHPHSHEIQDLLKIAKDKYHSGSSVFRTEELEFLAEQTGILSKKEETSPLPQTTHQTKSNHPISEELLQNLSEDNPTESAIHIGDEFAKIRRRREENLKAPPSPPSPPLSTEDFRAELNRRLLGPELAEILDTEKLPKLPKANPLAERPTEAIPTSKLPLPPSPSNQQDEIASFLEQIEAPS
ncbi:MAG: hypothetical protein D6805_08880, partial [Planctomycetota bacterium]